MKFIYVNSKEDKKKLQKLGYKFIKKQKTTSKSDSTLYVFENIEDDKNTSDFCLDENDIGCIYSNILIF
jgi:hypothetical protein